MTQVAAPEAIAPQSETKQPVAEPTPPAEMLLK